MNQEIWSKTVVVDASLADGEAPFCLEYCMIESDIKLAEGAIGALFYGVRIIKRDMQGVALECAEQADLFVSESACRGFLDLLIYGMVTPVSLEDVTEDWRGSLEPIPLSMGA